MKAQEVADQLTADQVSLKSGVFTARWGFFYTGGKSSKTYVDQVTRVFPGVTIVDHGEVWKPFKGTAPVAKQSHWFVKFTVS
jgi:hypothetical protein